MTCNPLPSPMPSFSCEQLEEALMAAITALILRTPDGLARCEAILEDCRQAGVEMGAIDEAGKVLPRLVRVEGISGKPAGGYQASCPRQAEDCDRHLWQ